MPNKTISKRIFLKYSDKLGQAIEDFYYLVNRGYNRDSVLDFVTARYKLSRLERLLIYRAVFDWRVSETRRKKIVSEKELSDAFLLIDGFNVLSTIQSSLYSDILVRGTDKIVRDLSAYMRKIRVSPHLITSLYISLLFIDNFSPKYVLYVFDSQVSKSMLMVRAVSCFTKVMNMLANGRIERNTDKYIITNSTDAIVVSSDSVIVDNVDKVYDLGGKVAEIISMETIIDLSEIL